MLVSVGFLIVLILTIIYEKKREKKQGIDPLAVFILLFSLNITTPAILIHSILSIDNNIQTGIKIWDNILKEASGTDAIFALIIATLFTISLYCFSLVNNSINKKSIKYNIEVNKVILELFIFVMVILIGSYLITFELNLSELYKRLIQLRAYADSKSYNSIYILIICLVQATLWISVMHSYVYYNRNKLQNIINYVAIVFLIFVSANRRSIIIPLLLLFIFNSITIKKWSINKLLMIFAILVPIICLGKDLQSSVANDNDTAITKTSYLSSALKTMVYIGSSYVESLGTIHLIDIPVRMGKDILFSPISMIPHGDNISPLSGIIEFPKRIVRFSTETFAAPDEQDIPPGALGQMWLDFRFLGPVFWAFFYTVQISFLEFLNRKLYDSKVKSGILGLLTFMVALPLNTGSLDYTFSIDIITIVCILFVCARLKRSYLAEVDSGCE
jgi:hypothetical protein